MRILVTGSAGFIGYHVARRLLERGDSVVGVDCVNDYYDPSLKEGRLSELEKLSDVLGSDYRFERADIADETTFEKCFAGASFDRVIHLAAQAGVRYSLENPQAYVHSNIVGFVRLLEACRKYGAGHLTYASTSSAYGGNTTLPFSEDVPADHPLQLYAATKRSNELMAHSYSHLFSLPTTGLRFFTVYGPWGRPDMALFNFTKLIIADEPIPVFNNGHHSRDFTYIDDIVDGIIGASDQIASSDPTWSGKSPSSSTSSAPWRIFNVGNGTSVPLLTYIHELENALGKKALLNLLPQQAGDVPDTHANTSALRDAVHWEPKTSVAEGVRKFVEWYLNYYNV